MRYLICFKLGLVLSAVMLVASCSDGGGTQLDDGPVDPPGELGTYAVGHTMFSVVDAARGDRELPVSVWYPVDEADASDGPLSRYPLAQGFTLPSEVAVDDLPVSSEARRALLIFSHGSGGLNTQSTQLTEALASHGFIVASPGHTGNTTTDDSDDKPEEKRVPDVSFVIDQMFARSNTPGDAFEGRIDESRVGTLDPPALEKQVCV